MERTSFGLFGISALAVTLAAIAFSFSGMLQAPQTHASTGAIEISMLTGDGQALCARAC